MNLARILSILQLAGTATPAFVELFNMVRSTFSEKDQEKLKAAYEEAQRRSDLAHEDLQRAARDAQG